VQLEDRDCSVVYHLGPTTFHVQSDDCDSGALDSLSLSLTRSDTLFALRYTLTWSIRAGEVCISLPKATDVNLSVNNSLAGIDTEGPAHAMVLNPWSSLSLPPS
jgi:hypothetical protein